MRVACSLVALGLAAAGIGTLSAAEAFLPLRLGEVKPEGWLRARMQRDLESGFAGHLDILLQDPKSQKFILQEPDNDFITRAKNKDCGRDEQGRSIPPRLEQYWWDGELVADWHDGVIRGAYMTGESRARAKADRFVAAILKSQDEDGYIGIYPKGCRFHFAGSEGELWTQRCVLLALLSYYELTGRADVLAAVERAVKLTLRQYGPGRGYFDNPAEGKSIGTWKGVRYLDVLEWLYRLKGDDEYRRAALFLFENYNAKQVKRIQASQLPALLDRSSPLGGHAPTILGSLRMSLLCHYLSGRQIYRDAWENSIVKIERHLGVGGAPLSGQNEDIVQAGQTPDMPYEYCASYQLLSTMIWAIQKTGEARFGDVFERSFFNAVQGARFPDGKALAYYSADERLWVRQKPPEGPPNARFIYGAAFFPACCHNSGTRVHPQFVSAMWMRNRGSDGDGLVAALYGPSQVSTRVNDTAVSITEKTLYPFDFDIVFSVRTDKQVKFPLRLRVPAWSGEPAVSAPGATVTRDGHGYLVVTKTWKTGDTVRLKLRPSIQERKAANQTRAIAYGPLVYSLPIPEKAEIVKRYPEAERAGLKDFYSYQYDPADLVSAKRPLRLQSKPAFGFKVVHDKNANPLHPWDRSPLTLRGQLIGANGKPETAVLLPMGCTILRRTFFPVGN